MSLRGGQGGWRTLSKASKEERVCTIANCFALFCPVEFAMDLRCQDINWLWVGEFWEDEGIVGDSPRRVAGGCCGCVGLGVCKLLTGNSFVLWG